jgi:hypothetical protein
MLCSQVNALQSSVRFCFPPPTVKGQPLCVDHFRFGLLAISLFCGAGGFCEGARMASWEVVAAVESVAQACQTHAANFPTQNLPATQTTTPQVVTFTGVPLGGNVTVNVGFYSDDDWLAGQGTIGPVANSDALSLVITITENQVPLQPTTVYTHTEVIKLNDSDDHVWFTTTTPPAETAPPGCNPVDGQLCQLTRITVNTTAAGVGYSFQSYNSAVTNYTDGAQDQLHQFANISITQNPQSDYLFSGCGFGATARVVYDLLGKPDFNFYLDPSTTGPDFNGVIRQVRLSSSDAGIDGPTSNKAWGRRQFDSDALLLQPAGQIISINSSVNKIEVITLPDAAVADDVAPFSQAYGGSGIRPGLMDGPVLAALAPDGTILVLESVNTASRPLT